MDGAVHPTINDQLTMVQLRLLKQVRTSISNSREL